MDTPKRRKIVWSSVGTILTVIGLGGWQDDVRGWADMMLTIFRALSADLARWVCVIIGVTILLAMHVPIKAWKESVWQMRTVRLIVAIGLFLFGMYVAAGIIESPKFRYTARFGFNDGKPFAELLDESGKVVDTLESRRDSDR